MDLIATSAAEIERQVVDVQRRVLEAYAEALAAAKDIGPVTINYACTCCDHDCGGGASVTMFTPERDAAMAVWPALQELAMGRRFQGMQLLPDVAALIRYVELCQGCALDMTPDETSMAMLAALGGIADALGAPLPKE